MPRPKLHFTTHGNGSGEYVLRITDGVNYVGVGLLNCDEAADVVRDALNFVLNSEVSINLAERTRVADRLKSLMW